MDPLTKSCSPTIVITANGEVQTDEEATVYVKELDTFLDYESPRKHASSIVARKALWWKRRFLWNGSTVKNHISVKTVFGYNGTRRTSFRSGFLACQVRLPDLTHQLQGHFQNGRDRLWPIPFWPSWFYQFWPIQFGPIHFGPSWFPGQFWPKPILANPILANPFFFGQSNFRYGVCHGGPQTGRPKPRKNRAPKGSGRVGPRRVGGPKFPRFSLWSHNFLSSLSWGSFCGILVVFWNAGALKGARLQFSERGKKRRKKKAKFWAVRRRGGPAQRGRAEQEVHKGVLRKGGTEGPKPTTTYNNNTTTHTQLQQHITPQHITKMDWPKMDWQKLDWPKSALTFQNRGVITQHLLQARLHHLQ